LSENRALGEIFGPKIEVVAGWEKLHNEDLHYFNSISTSIRVFGSRVAQSVWYLATDWGTGVSRSIPE
jgi:hypothetical protein